MTAPYRPHDPLVIGDHLWPVYGFKEGARFQREPVATMFLRSAAEDLAMHPDEIGFERRNLYVGAAREDRR